MAGMKWKKAPESLSARFAEVVPGDAGVERRSMFGYPCAFLNGHMLCGLFQDQFFIRLGDTERAKFLKQPGASVFEPMPGRAMKEYVLVPQPVLADDARLSKWLRESVDYVSALPPKESKAKTRKEPKGKASLAKPSRSAAKKPGRIRKRGSP